MHLIVPDSRKLNAVLKYMIVGSWEITHGPKSCMGDQNERKC